MVDFEKDQYVRTKGNKELGKKHTVMIVDDDKATLMLLKSSIEEEYCVITAEDGQEALDIIKEMEHPEKICVIISDQQMPNLTGLQIFENTKNIIPGTICMILTAFEDKKVMMDAINKVKIDKFLLKPIDWDDLKTSLKGAVESFEIQRKADNQLQTMKVEIQRLKGTIKRLEKINKQIRKKLNILNNLDSLIDNSQTLEVEIHKIFEKNLWIFGDEYSIMSSNKTLKNTVEKFLGKKYTGDSALNRPDLLLAQDIKDSFLLIEFKKPTHKLVRTDEAQAKAYRDELRTHFFNTRIDIILIGGGVKENISVADSGNDVQFLSYQFVISRARNRLKCLVEE